MKITQVLCQALRLGPAEAKTSSCQDTVLVRVQSGTGLEGIGEVLLNLLVNALDAMPGGGRRAISIAGERGQPLPWPGKSPGSL
jgi:C4-dicarboxylate-specific signal transduction histidine kinase